MILIAPDKYRGTMTAEEAASIIASEITAPKIVFPMADGGEGTARCVASLTPGWEKLGEGCYYNSKRNEIALDSSAVIGHSGFASDIPPLSRTTARLGETLNELYARFRPVRMYLGIGGTATCDGGAGMLEVLNKSVEWDRILVGLVDVDVPLLPEEGCRMSALSFCAQKGFTDNDTREAARRLGDLVERYGVAPGAFAGAGGGLGYAVGGILGAKCEFGAQWLLDHSGLNPGDIKVIITGEGRFDLQTDKGKVVSTLARWRVGPAVPVIVLAGSVSADAKPVAGLEIVDLSRYLPHESLSPVVARERLQLAVKQNIKTKVFL